jgi:hypothetical protein
MNPPSRIGSFAEHAPQPPHSSPSSRAAPTLHSIYTIQHSLLRQSPIPLQSRRRPHCPPHEQQGSVYNAREPALLSTPYQASAMAAGLKTIIALSFVCWLNRNASSRLTSRRSLLLASSSSSSQLRSSTTTSPFSWSQPMLLRLCQTGYAQDAPTQMISWKAQAMLSLTSDASAQASWW